MNAEKKTKRRMAIKDALDQLMDERPLEQIKVVDICERAGVARSTFYEYFDNVFAVVNWYWDYLMDRSLYQIGLTMTCNEGQLKCLEELVQNRRFFVNAYKHKDYDSVLWQSSFTEKHFLESVAMARLHRSLTRSEIIEIEFYNYGAANMTRQWLLMDYASVRPEELLASFEKCASPFFHKVFYELVEELPGNS